MKNIFLFVVLCFLAEFIVAQNVGIGVAAPGQKLDVNGAIKVGTTATNQPGTIRYNAGKFESGDGTKWTSFEALPSGTIVLSSSYPDTNLVMAGFNYAGSIEGPKRRDSSLSFPANRWLAISTNGAPADLDGISSISIGNDLFVFGGRKAGTLSNQGFIYSKALDKWEAISTLNAPSPRTAASLVYTGTELIVFGGNGYGISTNFYGAKYNLSTKTWMQIPSLNAPLPRIWFTHLWSGTELIIWGGSAGTALQTGGRYNAATNTWTTMSTVNAPSARVFAKSIWTGTECIVWGGQNDLYLDLFNGAKYNPSTNTWITINGTNAPVNRVETGTIQWTGTEMIIWGGKNAAEVVLQSGAKYNPVSNTWTTTSLINAPTAREVFNAHWTGSQMIVWGGRNGSTTQPSGARYTASTNTWTAMSTVNAPPGRQNHQSAWTGSQLVVWGGTQSVVDPDFGNISKDFNDGYAYNTATNLWSKLTQGNAPQERKGNNVSGGLLFYWAGDQLIIWGGLRENVALNKSVQLFDGGRYFFTTVPGYKYFEGAVLQHALYKKN